MTPSEISRRLLTLLRSPRYQPLDRGQLGQKLKLGPLEQTTLKAVLRELEQSGEVARVRRDRYVLPEEAELVTGVIQIHSNGSAHLLSERKDQPDLYVAAENVWTAMPGDTVVARILHPGLEGVETLRKRRRHAPSGRREGRVIRILKRAHETLVGTLQRTKKFFYVVPDDPRFIHDVYVHPGEKALPHPPQVGDKVVVKLDEWVSRHINPEGEIIEVLGPAGAQGVDMLSIIRKHELPTDFPPEVIAEAESISEKVAPREIARREDLRDELIYTIDPDDARDFDDAISVRKTKEGWRLGIHIADVSHYVTPESELDREASKRGNSVYLVDRVIPMLPERLSNGICSLKPGVERLTHSVFIDFTRNGKFRKARFSRSVIRSVARLTYKQALAILTGETSEPLPMTVPDRTEEIPREVEENVKEAWQLASILRQGRFAAGSLDLEFPEVKVWLNEKGVPERLEKITNDISHQLIEEFMLAANEAVARQTKQKGAHSLYRVHEDPAEEKLQEFRMLVRNYGYRVGDLSQKDELGSLLQAIKGSAEEYALKIAFLRSLRRAEYRVEPHGHYGLAKVNYTHFTSPIRRYADLVVHRVLGNLTAGKQASRVAAGDLPATAARLSITERTAEEAERESVKLKKIEFFMLAADRGENFEAVILDVRNYGMVIELPDSLITGLVHVSALEGDFFTFDPVRYRFIGRKSGKIYAVGDRLRVEVMKVDIFKQQIDFRPMEEKPRKGKTTAARPAKPGKAVRAGREKEQRRAPKNGFGPAEKPSRKHEPKGAKSGSKPNSKANSKPNHKPDPKAARKAPRQPESKGKKRSAR